MALTSIAQEKVYRKDELEVKTSADGRLRYSMRDFNMNQFNREKLLLNSEEKLLLNGLCRIVDRWSQGSYVIVEFKRGMYNGKYQRFHNNKLMEESSYKDGKKEGISITYHENGQQRGSVTYKNNKKNGLCISYSRNGVIEQICPYIEDKIDGIFKDFYSTGIPESEYTFKSGKREGNYKLFYYCNGTLREEGRYEADVNVYRKEYYKNGELKVIAEFKDDNWEILEQYESSEELSNLSEQIILSQTDSLRVARCQQTVAQINDSLSLYDVSEFNCPGGYFEISLDKSGRLRKFFCEFGEIEYIVMTVYYNTLGELVQIECSDGSNCENEDAIYYIDNGIVVDCKIMFDCPCCEDYYDYPQELTEKRLQIMGLPFEKHTPYLPGVDNLADFINADNVLLKLSSQKECE